MRTNGNIHIISIIEGGLDYDGNPIGSETNIEEPIPAMVQINKLNNLGKTSADNAFTMASYCILIDQQEINSERIRVDFQGRQQDFSIMYIEQLDLVGKTKIIV